jgi:DAPG hydrolase PhiG domain
MLAFEDAHLALSPAPMPLEMGVSRLDSGTLLVAARTDMPHCSGEMFEWWFRFAPDTKEYLWWHPLDHVSSEWRETNPRTHVGSTHVVRERLAGSEEIHDLLIHFVGENEFFGGGYAAQARQEGSVSGLVCAHIGIGHDGPTDEQGRPLGGRMCHVARDTTNGMVLRSRFWLGYDAPPEVARQIPDSMGLQLMQHANTEFRYLAKYLPSLYRADPETAAAQDIW